MSRYLRISQLFGILPFGINREQFTESAVMETVNRSLSLIVIIIFFVALTLDGIIPRNVCSDPLYIVTDRFILLGSIPFVNYHLFQNKKKLLQILNDSCNIFAENHYSFELGYVMATRIAVQVAIIIYVAFVNFYALTECPTHLKLTYIMSTCYWWAMDIFFYTIHRHTTDALKLLTLAMRKRLPLDNKQDFFDMKESIFNALLNIQKANKLMGPFALLTAASLLAQPVALYDFSLRDLEINVKLLFLLCGAFKYLTRAGHICWITSLPAGYVSSHQKNLKNVSAFCFRLPIVFNNLKGFTSVMFELLALPQLSGIFPCSRENGHFTVKPMLAITNAIIISLLIILHCVLLTQTNDKFQTNLITFFCDNFLLGFSCVASLTVLLSKRKTLCKLINQIISDRNSLPNKSINRSDFISYPSLLRYTFGVIGSCTICLIDNHVWTQIFIFNIFLFFNTVANLIFLALMSETYTSLTLYNLCLSDIGPAFLSKRTFYLKCQLLLGTINEEFSFINILQVLNSLLQCVVSVNYYKDAPAESKTIMLFCMVTWSTGYLIEQLNIISTCLTHAEKIHETSKLLEIMSMQPECDHLYSEIETFSLQLYHFDIDFDACGFFKFNYSFLHSMAGTIVTYALIVKQIRY